MNPGLFLREMPSRAPRNGTHDEAILRFRKKKKASSFVFGRIKTAFCALLCSTREERDDEEWVERRKSRERIQAARGFDVATRVFE